MNNLSFLQKAIEMMENDSRLVLCGSLALILSKNIPDREVNDLDFVFIDAPSKFNLTNHYKAREDHIYEQEGYVCYKTYVSPHGNHANIFVFDDHKSILIEELTIFGKTILIQNPEQMLQYKKLYDRPKDRKDLGIEEKVFTSDDIPF
jgi:hypothetical protein